MEMQNFAFNRPFVVHSPEKGSGGGGHSHHGHHHDDLFEGTHIDALLHIAVEQNASDLHFQAGDTPVIRVNGELIRVVPFQDVKVTDDVTRVTRNSMQRMVYEILTDEQINKFETSRELDLSYALPPSKEHPDCKARFRVNIFQSMNGIGAVCRLIPGKIPDFKSLGLPQVIEDLAELPRGLVLVTGITGSGKSTTLASTLDLINATQKRRIFTIEDPVEYLHQSKMSLVSQREIGPHTQSFTNALRAVLREDPDVILVGEMRDLETMEIAIRAAETGHLVFATLHTANAPESIDRIVDAFPANQQEQIRVQLGNNLKAILSQQLLPSSDGKGRVPAVEVMIANSGIKNMIRKNQTHMIPNAIQGGGKEKMQSMDRALADLVLRGRVKVEEALLRAQSRDEFMKMMSMPPGNGGTPPPGKR